MWALILVIRLMINLNVIGLMLFSPMKDASGMSHHIGLNQLKRHK
jgi:hypothetical protein